MNSNGEVVIIGDTCMVFCAEGYQVVSDVGVCAQQETSISQAVVSLLHLDGEAEDGAEKSSWSGTHLGIQVRPLHTKDSKRFAMFAV